MPLDEYGWIDKQEILTFEEIVRLATIFVQLVADGKLVTCLFSDRGHDLKALIRNGASDEEVRDVISAVWRVRTDRYSDERLEAMKSGHGYEAKAHKKIEMITLGTSPDEISRFLGFVEGINIKGGTSIRIFGLKQILPVRCRSRPALSLNPAPWTEARLDRVG